MDNILVLIQKKVGSDMSTIFRIEKNRDFVVMNNRFLRNKKMSLKAKGALSLFLSLPDDWQYSINGLASICKESQTAIRSTLKELEEHNHLRRVREQDEKGQFRYIYYIYELPYDGNEHADKGNAQNAHKESKRQQSNKRENKEYKKYNINNYIYLLDIIPDPQLRNLYCDFLDNRNRMGAPLSTTGFEYLIERVREIAGLDVEKQKSLLKTAIINNWKNVYPRGEEPGSAAMDELKKFYSN
jgi:hypothetical protein